MRIMLLLCSIFLLPLLSEAQQKKAQPTKTAAPQQNACHLSDAERQELERNLEKMRTLIDQMQRNLAATSTGESPLKYQFQLDIQMWQLVVQQMERRLEGSAKR